MKHLLQTKLEELGYDPYNKTELGCLAIDIKGGPSSKKHIILGIQIGQSEDADKLKCIGIKSEGGRLCETIFWPSINYFNIEAEIKQYLLDDITEQDIKDYKNEEYRDEVIDDLANSAYVELDSNSNFVKIPEIYFSITREILDSFNLTSVKGDI